MLRTVLCVPFLAAALACQSAPEAPADAAAQTEAPKPEAWQQVAEVSIDELEGLMAKGECTVVDANSAETRNEFGIIPSAVALSSYKEFDPAKELPADKNANLVFYCGSTACTAAPKAAVRAQEAGYTNVSHLKVGIKGWVAAGKAVKKPPKG